MDKHLVCFLKVLRLQCLGRHIEQLEFTIEAIDDTSHYIRWSTQIEAGGNSLFELQHSIVRRHPDRTRVLNHMGQVYINKKHAHHHFYIHSQSQQSHIYINITTCIVLYFMYKRLVTGHMSIKPIKIKIKFDEIYEKLLTTIPQFMHSRMTILIFLLVKTERMAKSL